MTRALISAALFWLAMTAPLAAQQKVDLPMVLAIDSSSSVDDREFQLQLKGLADAFRDRAIVDSIKSGKIGGIAITVMEWSGVGNQKVSIPWTHVHNAERAGRLASGIEAAGRFVESGSTSLSSALRRAVTLFDDNGFADSRRVIDVSGDSYNNQAPPRQRGSGFRGRSGHHHQRGGNREPGVGSGGVFSRPNDRRPVRVRLGSCRL